MWFKRLTGAFSRFGKSSVETAKAFDDLFNCFKGDDKKMFDFTILNREYIHCAYDIESRDLMENLDAFELFYNIPISYYGFDKGDYPVGYFYISCNVVQQRVDVYYIGPLCGITDKHLEWSDFMGKKIFTKADLKNGDVIMCRNGTTYIVCVDTGTIICQTGGWLELSHFNPDLKFTSTFENEYDIMQVRRPTHPSHCRFTVFRDRHGDLIYDRERDDPEVEEMTMDDVCKALGKRVKIVDRK